MEQILKRINEKIKMLEQARELLLQTELGTRAARAVETTEPSHHEISEKGRKAIANAQKRRWAAAKRSSKTAKRKK